jgi:hypothetical protein
MDCFRHPGNPAVIKDESNKPVCKKCLYPEAVETKSEQSIYKNEQSNVE